MGHDYSRLNNQEKHPSQVRFDQKEKKNATTGSKNARFLTPLATDWKQPDSATAETA